jgi:hypothetical protein
LPASARVQLRLEELEKIDTTNLLALPGIGMFGIGLAGLASMPAVLGSPSVADVRILSSFPGSAITGVRAGPADIGPAPAAIIPAPVQPAPSRPLLTHPMPEAVPEAGELFADPLSGATHAASADGSHFAGSSGASRPIQADAADLSGAPASTTTLTPTQVDSFFAATADTGGAGGPAYAGSGNGPDAAANFSRNGLLPAQPAPTPGPTTAQAVTTAPTSTSSAVAAKSTLPVPAGPSPAAPTAVVVGTILASGPTAQQGPVLHIANTTAFPMTGASLAVTATGSWQSLTGTRTLPAIAPQSAIDWTLTPTPAQDVSGTASFTFQATWQGLSVGTTFSPANNATGQLVNFLASDPGTPSTRSIGIADIRLAGAGMGPTANRAAANGPFIQCTSSHYDGGPPSLGFNTCPDPPSQAPED